MHSIRTQEEQPEPLRSPRGDMWPPPSALCQHSRPRTLIQRPHRRTLVLGTAGTLAVYDVAAATGALSLTLTRPPRPTFNHPTPNPSRKPLSGALSLRASSALGTCDEAALSPGKVRFVKVLIG